LATAVQLAWVDSHMQGHPAGAYGSTNDPLVIAQKVVPRRWRLNWLAVLEAILVPFSLFVLVLYLLTFSVHYEHTLAVDALVGTCALVPIFLWARVLKQRLDPTDNFQREPNWFLFLAGACSLAWLAAFVLGMSNWSSNMKPYYERVDLAMPKDVNTRTTRGGQFMDVGALTFQKGTSVLEGMTMAYKDGDLYCVAPILTSEPNASAPATYDFWAVGINCCEPFDPKLFVCGQEPTEDQASGGMRMMDTGLIGPYRKAIQMAQEEYGIKAGKTPLLLEWYGDPIKSIESHYAAGKSMFQSAIAAYFAFSAILAGLEAMYYHYQNKRPR